MDKFKSVAKGGWHPEKSRTNSGSGGGGASDSKLTQVKGWVGKAQGKDPHAEAARDHQSAPLSSLKDPSQFAPPPKRLDYSGGSAASAPSGPSSAPAGSAKQRLQEREEARRREEEEANRPAPGPYRPDTTGLSTAHLPKPPAFRPGAATPPTAGAAKPKPSLPPRPPLPPRQNSNPDEFAPAPPPTYNEATQEARPEQGVLNQGALGRLGQAGVSVSGFGIGRTASPPVPPRANPSPPVPPRQNSSSRAVLPPPAPPSRGSQMNELQSRFASMSGPKSPAAPPATGTSWADKQAALRTASSLRDDPSKVSASDLKGAASTANNFQQRHGDQVASGWKSANSINQKYGIAGKMNNLASSSASPGPAQSSSQSSAGGLGKKAPPPPPPKKKELSDGSGEPPPIPLSSKPKF
ncbi:uncharacterized protein J4E92_011030 [Alternaria infectoria]|uniref:uncharacterized protein n=1 Tax=Alternaria infectoria TaxID=45303 RepID=UPI00222081FC|nr:uncharacterized protein J4E92_011030 [Alternaria infectoria]KAI4907985.1 hypothetical protein J4E92_011030 [Alternaria infectoria]